MHFYTFDANDVHARLVAPAFVCKYFQLITYNLGIWLNRRAILRYHYFRSNVKDFLMNLNQPSRLTAPIQYNYL